MKNIGLFIFLIIGFTFSYYKMQKYEFSLIIPFGIALIFFLLVFFLRKWKKKKYTNLILSLSSIVLVLFFFELGMYSSGFLRTYIEKNEGRYFSLWEPMNKSSWNHLSEPGKEWAINRPEFSYLKKANSIGIRSAEFPLEKDSNEYRIIVLGDSFTEGVGAPMDSIYPVFLEKYLSKELPNRNIKVLGAGCSGSDPYFEYKLYKEKLSHYEPDMIIFSMNRSDLFEDLVIRGGFERFQADTTLKYNEPPIYEPLFASSFLVRLYMLAVEGTDLYLLSRREKLKAAKFDYTTNLMLKLMKKANDELVSEGIEVVLIHHLMNYEVYDFLEGRKNFKHELFLEKRINEIVPYIYLDSAMIQQGDITKGNFNSFYWPIDNHHNSRGYKVLGEAVGYELIKRNLITNN